jgi:hypothetical protein
VDAAVVSHRTGSGDRLIAAFPSLMLGEHTSNHRLPGMGERHPRYDEVDIDRPELVEALA